MVHIIGQSVGDYTNATHGMTLSIVSIAYYRFICQYELAKFKRFAVNILDVNPAEKTDEQIAAEGLDLMEAYMNEIGLVMNLTDLGVTEDMISGIANGTFIMEGGYKVLTQNEIIEILKKNL